jgi:hypothetical protein
MKKMILIALVLMGFVACNEGDAKSKVESASEEQKGKLSETQEKVKDVIYDNRVKGVEKAKRCYESSRGANGRAHEASGRLTVSDF